MNFLSHYYFEQSFASPLRTLGCVLPDMAKACNRTWHPKPELITHFNANEALIYLGWQRHIKVDGIFHNHPYFLENEKRISKQIQERIDFQRPIRAFTLAHIGFEILLDYLLMKEEKIQPLNFYSALESIDIEIINAFLVKSGIVDTENFEAFYDRFNSGKFLMTYTHNKGIAQALNSLCKRFFKAEITEPQLEILHEIMTEHLEYINKDYFCIFDDIDKQLKA